MTFQANKLSEDISVSGQIMPGDIEAIKKAGFKSVINNRPDGEKPGQPLSEDLSQLIGEAGMEIRTIPMSPGRLTPELLDDTARALNELPKPILAFCASGTRSTILWCCINVKEMGADTVLRAAMNAGYDLEQIRPLLNQLSQ